MSYDIKLQTYCDHRIQWYRAELETDRKTIYLPYPIASVSSLKIRINGVEQNNSAYTVKSVRQYLSLIVVSHIEFFKKIKDNGPIIEVNYTTLLDNCPKCVGVKVIDDFYINGEGDYEMVSKEILLLQQVEKIIVTQQTTNIFHTWYGTSLHSFIGIKQTNRELLKTRIREQISTAIEKLKTIQNQMEASGRKFDPEELFGKLLGIDVEDTDDPTILLVTVNFTSKSNYSIEYSQYLSLNTTTTRQRMVL
jgi:hypothetical protein